MGRYTRKAKHGGDVAVMEVSRQTPLGVLTRARNLALQRLQKPPAAPDSSGAYLELRSRRLEKPPRSSAPPARDGIRKCGGAELASPKANSSPSPGSGLFRSVSGARCLKSAAESEGSPEVDGGAEVSFGENALDPEAGDRNARETTPCSLMRGPETMETPGSTTRSKPTANSRMLRSIRRHGGAMPTASEIDELFAAEERRAQQQFMEKYNFDIVNERPLPGRYEWIELQL